MVAEPVQLHRPRMGRPSKVERDLLIGAVDTARVELVARHDEEMAQAALAGPLVSRLYLIAQDYGPVAMQTVRALDHWHVRHERRWTPEEAA